MSCLHLDLIFHTWFSLVFFTYFVKTYFFPENSYQNVSHFTYFFFFSHLIETTIQDSFYGGLSYLGRIFGRPYPVLCISFLLFNRSQSILFSDIHTWLIDFKHYLNTCCWYFANASSRRSHNMCKTFVLQSAAWYSKTLFLYHIKRTRYFCFWFLWPLLSQTPFPETTVSF